MIDVHVHVKCICKTNMQDIYKQNVYTRLIFMHVIVCYTTRKKWGSKQIKQVIYICNSISVLDFIG